MIPPINNYMPNFNTAGFQQGFFDVAQTSSPAVFNAAAQGNVLTQLLTGLLGPGALANMFALLGSSTSVAQMLGVPNIMNRASAIMATTDAMNLTNELSPNRNLEALRVSSAFSKVSAMMERQYDNRDPWYIDQMTQNGVIAHMAKMGNLRREDLATLGDEGSRPTTDLKKASQIVKVSQRLIGMSGDVSEMINTAMQLGGSDNFEKAANNYLEYVNNLVEAGLTMGERMNTIAATLQMKKALLNKGLSSESAADIAKRSVGGAAVAEAQARRGGYHIDTTRTANYIASIDAQYMEEEGFESNVAIRAASVISDPAIRQAYLNELVSAGTNREAIASIVNKYGVSAQAKHLTETYVGRKGKITEFMSEDQLTAAFNVQRMSTFEDQASAILKELDRHPGGTSADARKLLQGKFAQMRAGKAVTFSKEEMALISENVDPASVAVMQGLNMKMNKNAVDNLARGFSLNRFDMALDIMGDDSWKSFQDNLTKISKGDASGNLKIQDLQKADFIKKIMAQEGISEKDAEAQYNKFVDLAKDSGGLSLRIADGEMIRMDKSGTASLVSKEAMKKIEQDKLEKEAKNNPIMLIFNFLKEAMTNGKPLAEALKTALDKYNNVVENDTTQNQNK